MKYILSIILLGSSLVAGDALAVIRLSKTDKLELEKLFNSFADEMGRTEQPFKQQMSKIERSIDQLNQMALEIQNNFALINPEDGKESFNKILKQLAEIKTLLQAILQELIEQHIVLGDLDDQSVGEQDFNSVQDIDNAELSLVTWLKSVYREQLAAKFNS